MAQEPTIRGTQDRSTIIVFTRFPEPGKVKTRLISALGAGSAADLQRRMTERTLRTARDAARRTGAEVEVCFTGSDESGMKQWLGAECRLSPQIGSDLGERMASALQAGLDRGCERILLIGTDCPELTAKILDSAFRAMDQHDVVVGPAADGGYYLIGMKRPCPALFRNVSWGTSLVFDQTMANTRAAGLSVHLTDVLRDVDTPDDLPVWESTAGPSGRE